MKHHFCHEVMLAKHVSVASLKLSHPITDLEPLMGAGGNSVIISSDSQLSNPSLFIAILFSSLMINTS
jgi:hypothetical protein